MPISFADLGNWTTSVVLPVFTLFREEHVAPSIAAIMVIAAFVFWGIFFFFVWRFRHKIKKCSNFIEDCPNSHTFSTKFDHFDKMMRDVEPLRPHWLEYKKTLLKCSEGSIESTVRPNDFINLAELEHSGLKLKWFHAVPSIFVGFGLLCTFLGLVAALYFASQAIHAVGGAEIDAAQQSIKMQAALAQLLSAATFKFWTSIAGLGSSIVLGMLYRWSIRWLDGHLNALCWEIERCTVMVTPEMLAQRQLDVLSEQSNQLKEFNGQLATNLGRALEDALQKTMPQVMSMAIAPTVDRISDMVASIDSLHNAMPDVMHNAISPITKGLDTLTQNMAQELGSMVSESTGAEIRETVKALALIKDALMDVSQQVLGSGSGLSHKISEAAEELRAAAKTITGNISELTSAVQEDVDRGRSALNAQLQETTAALNNTAEVIRASLADAGNKMRSSTEEAGSLFSQQIADAIGCIDVGTQANAAAMRETFIQLHDMTMHTTGKITAETSAIVANMREAAEQTAHTVANISVEMQQSAQKETSGLAERLVKAAEAMQEASHHNAQRIGEAIERIIAAGNKAESSVSEAAKQSANRITVGVHQVLATLKKNIDDLNGDFGQLGDRLEKVTGAMNVVEDKMGLHAQTLGSVNDATKETCASLSAVALHVNQAVQSLQDNIDSSARTIEAAVKALGETQAQTTGLSQEISKTLTELKFVWNQHISRFEKTNENLGEVFSKIIDFTDKNKRGMSEHVDKIDTALAKTVELFSGNIEALDETAKELKEATQSLQNAQARRSVYR